VADVAARVVWSPKLGNRPEEWEDGCALSEHRGRFAVTDGASSSYRAGEWARQVASAFIDGGPAALEPGPFDEWLAGIAARHERENPPASSDSPSAWYVSEAAARGSFCTFLGLEIRSDGTRTRWRASAVGDSCAFHVRDGVLLSAFPLDDATAFGTTPPLVSSLPHGTSNGGRAVQSIVGDAIDGDVLILATDAVAEWALGSTFVGVWTLLSALPAAALGRLVDELRGSEEMVNDDVTVVRCQVGAR